MKRIPSLDGLRAIAVLMVISGHLLGGKSGWTFLFASMGVQIFFVLSGYLITGLLLKEQEANGRISLAAFYRRRCFRIFPAAFTYILVIAAVIPASHSGLPYAATYTVCYHLNGILNTKAAVFGHLWSLSVEEQFYLLWPLAIFLFYRSRGRIAWAALAVSAAVRLALTFSGYPDVYLHFTFPTAMDSLAVGCLLAIYEPQIKSRVSWMAESPAIVIALPLTAWAILPMLWGGIFSVLWVAVPALIALWMILLVERQDKILNNRPIAFVGALSYSLYLWQQPFTAENMFPLWLGLPALLGCALLSYFCIERPMIRVGRVRRPILITEASA